MVGIQGNLKKIKCATVAAATVAVIVTCLPRAAFSYGTGGAELRELYHGARPLAMGGAFTAVADDEHAIWYNPAGLAAVQGTSIHLMPVNLELSTGFITDSKALGELGSASTDSINAFMGKDVFGRGQAAPSFVMPSFGVSVLVDGQAALYARNKALPQMLIGYQNTNGVQAAFGISVSNPGRKNKKRTEVYLGAAAKMLYRRGGYRLLSTTEMINISSTTLGALAGNYEKGYGGDLGSQVIFRANPRLSLKAGLAWTDIGDTGFGGAADPVKSNLSAGLAATYQWTVMRATLAYDYRHIMANAEGRKKSHLGFELALPVVSVYGGLNQLYLTYGASVDLSLVKFTLVSYAEEIATNAAMDPDRRYVLAIDIKLGI